MSKELSIEKLKRIIYSCLRWRLQLPTYVPHNSIPHVSKLGTFSQGVLCAYRDLLEEIDQIEKAQNQRKSWRLPKGWWYGVKVKDLDLEKFMDEIRNAYKNDTE